MREKQCLYNLLCSNSGEYGKRLFFGDGDSSSDGATVWTDKARGETAVEEEDKGLPLCGSPAFCTIAHSGCCHRSIRHALSACQFPSLVGPT